MWLIKSFLQTSTSFVIPTSVTINEVQQFKMALSTWMKSKRDKITIQNQVSCGRKTN